MLMVFPTYSLIGVPIWIFRTTTSRHDTPVTIPYERQVQGYCWKNRELSVPGRYRLGGLVAEEWIPPSNTFLTTKFCDALTTLALWQIFRRDRFLTPTRLKIYGYDSSCYVPRLILPLNWDFMKLLPRLYLFDLTLLRSSNRYLYESLPPLITNAFSKPLAWMALGRFIRWKKKSLKKWKRNCFSENITKINSYYDILR